MTTTRSPTLNGNGGGGSVAGGTSGVSEVKLKRFLEHNQRLKEQLEMQRISGSEASESLIKFVTSTKDSLLPTLWGNAPSDPFSKQSTGCCTIS
ncbi:G-protein gamma subunit [Dissophora ornata]|nr:G-protein gamma subunit [Dissophora ornata]